MKKKTQTHLYRPFARVHSQPPSVPVDFHSLQSTAISSSFSRRLLISPVDRRVHISSRSTSSSMLAAAGKLQSSPDREVSGISARRRFRRPPQLAQTSHREPDLLRSEMTIFVMDARETIGGVVMAAVFQPRERTTPGVEAVRARCSEIGLLLGDLAEDAAARKLRPNASATIVVHVPLPVADSASYCCSSRLSLHDVSLHSALPLLH